MKLNFIFYKCLFNNYVFLENILMKVLHIYKKEYIFNELTN